MKQKKGLLFYREFGTETIEDKVLNWWKLEKVKIPTSCQYCKKKYFAALSSSVYSERFFSEAGNFYEQKRNQLLPETSEKLLFSTTT